MTTELNILIEINGREVSVGKIKGDTTDTAAFCYHPEYIDHEFPPISISLPIQRKAFTPEQTCIFFEGLLPEGFTRKSVSKWLKVVGFLASIL